MIREAVSDHARHDAAALHRALLHRAEICNGRKRTHGCHRQMRWQGPGPATAPGKFQISAYFSFTIQVNTSAIAGSSAHAWMRPLNHVLQKKIMLESPPRGVRKVAGGCCDVYPRQRKHMGHDVFWNAKVTIACAHAPISRKREQHRRLADQAEPLHVPGTANAKSLQHSAD